MRRTNRLNQTVVNAARVEKRVGLLKYLDHLSVAFSFTPMLAVAKYLDINRLCGNFGKTNPYGSSPYQYSDNSSRVDDSVDQLVAQLTHLLYWSNPVDVTSFISYNVTPLLNRGYNTCPV